MGRVGPILRRLGDILEPSWAPLGPSWPSWRLSCASWRPLEPSLGPLGAVWAASGAVLGPSCGLLGPSWDHLGASWSLLGPSWWPKAEMTKTLKNHGKINVFWPPELSLERPAWLFGPTSSIMDHLRPSWDHLEPKTGPRYAEVRRGTPRYAEVRGVRGPSAGHLRAILRPSRAIVESS